jgi:phage terminase large subunit GpA-like protein
MAATRTAAPPPKLTISEWADRYRRLSSESSAEPGAWLTRRAEYQRGIMDAISEPGVERIVLMTSAQVGKTEILNNVVGFHVAQDPAPILFLQPTLEMAETWAKDRLAPMLRDTPALTDKVADPRSRDSGNTILHKRFNGGHITAVGANSPSGLASRPIRVVLADEVDRYPPSAGTEGDPLSLAVKRTTTFWNRRVVMCSTPTIKGISRIEAEWDRSDQRRYFVACPHCKHEQHLVWKQVKWPEGRPDEAEYSCEECGTLWSDAERRTAIRWGKWKSTATASNKVVGFHLNELYSPWSSIASIAIAFVEAKRSPETLKTWVNTSLGETWEDQGETVNQNALMERCEAWGDEAPYDVLVVSCGVDVQDDRFEIERVGWGLGEESWSLDYHIIYADPSTPQAWQQLDDYLLTPTKTSDGRVLPVAATCIDSGGHHTQAVYAFVKVRARRHVNAIKGMAGSNRPIWPKRSSKNNKGKINLFAIGVDTAKDSIYSRLRIAEPGPGFCHFPEGRDKAWFDQLTAETVVTKYLKGFPVRVWQKRPSVRNEALDCRVYAYAALLSTNPTWARLARRAEQDAIYPREQRDASTQVVARQPSVSPVIAEKKTGFAFRRGVSRSRFMG